MIARTLAVIAVIVAIWNLADNIQIAEAAEVKTISQKGAQQRIELLGDLIAGDAERFNDLTVSTRDALVLFSSRGGNLVAGIEIGKIIHTKGFTTVVPDGAACASACALAWLGGRRRLMGRTAHVGFHAAYFDHEGEVVVSSGGNALVGAYLNELGLPTAAILYITQAPPQGMQWLRQADADRVGIRIETTDHPIVNFPDKEKNLAARISTDPMARQIAAVEGATYRFVLIANGDASEAVANFGNIYADRVVYFGKIMRKSDVLADKRASLQMWPERRFRVRPESLTIRCESPRYCESRGIIEWAMRNGSSHKSGVAGFMISWSLLSDTWRVTGEDNKVISSTSSEAPR